MSLAPNHQVWHPYQTSLKEAVYASIFSNSGRILEVDPRGQHSQALLAYHTAP
jgi:hypothetical protein